MVEIILDEREWAERALLARSLGTKPSATLGHIAKYYRQVCGYDAREVREKLEQHILRCDADANLFWWSDFLDKVVKSSNKQPLINVDGVHIYKSELETVSSVGSVQTQRLAFAMLCIARYWNAVRGVEVNNCWINMDPSDIVKFANVNTSTQRVNEMYRKLWECGFITLSKRVDNLNCRVMAVDESGEEAMFVVDFRNLGNQYMMYDGKDYIPCEVCGLVVRRSARNQKYCQKCAGDIHIKKTIDNAQRRRSASLYDGIKS